MPSLLAEFTGRWLRAHDSIQNILTRGFRTSRKLAPFGQLWSLSCVHRPSTKTRPNRGEAKLSGSRFCGHLGARWMRFFVSGPLRRSANASFA
jgi:hypothetical protein